jgi:hypothetical protein
MANYKQPSKINAVSVFLLLMLAAAVYAIIQYGPPYWRTYKVKEILDQAATKCRGNRKPNDEKLDQLEQDSEKRIIDEAGIEDTNVRVRISVGPKEVTVSATYVEQVRHWFVSKVSTLNFKPEIKRERIQGF